MTVKICWFHKGAGGRWKTDCKFKDIQRRSDNFGSLFVSGITKMFEKIGWEG